MTKEEHSILETLDKIVRREQVCAQIQPILERVRTDLARDEKALMKWAPIPLEIFSTALPAIIKSAWVFVLRAGADTGAERHPNSHQRMMSFEATGDLQTDAQCGQRSIQTESEIAWQSNILVSNPEAPLEQRWISIPQNVWHRPIIPKVADWAVVSFHTVTAEELIEERPDSGGTKQMLYIGGQVEESKQVKE